MKGSRAWGLFAALIAVQAQAAAPAISIVIDDLGDKHAEGNAVAELPGPVACAILPGTPFGPGLARAAHDRGKEVLLHFPLEPVVESKAHPQAITMRSDRGDLAQHLRADLDALPYLSGVNTHQGSLLTQQTQPMHWLMSELKTRGGLYFIDSYTSAASVALRTAQSWGLPTTRRDVFLDDSRNPQEIQAQFMRLVTRAQRGGSALAIGHPYPETIAVLRRELPKLQGYGVRLVSPSELIAVQAAARPAQPQQRLPLLLQLSTGLSPLTSTGTSKRH